MNVLGVLLLLVAVPPPADRVKLLPVPTSAELAKAERTIKEVFGDDLKRARKPADKAALARKMIATAEGSDPAERYALLVRARELAIDARDLAAGVQAAEGLAGFAGNSDASEGHRLWGEARGLAEKLAAAEVYLRALPALTGFQRVAVEKRLRELGWRASPIDFTFEHSVEGWTAENHIVGLKVEGGCLVGRITGGDPYMLRGGLAVTGETCRVLIVRMSVTGATRAQLFWDTKRRSGTTEDRHVDFAVRGDGELHTYRIPLKGCRFWTGETVTAIRLDPGEWDHREIKDERFSIDYVRGGTLLD